MKREHTYTVVFDRDEDGCFVATIPALGVSVQARDRSAALRRLGEAVESYTQARKARGWPIPRESENVISTLKVAV